MVEYRIDVFSSAGEKRAEITDYLTLSYSKKVNQPGLARFVLAGDHKALEDFEDKGQVIIYRRNPELGLDWTPDFWGLFRAEQRWHTNHALFEARCPGILTMLFWRVIAWYAGVEHRSKFSGPAETIAKTLVEYNAGSSALTTNGRVWDGVISGLVVEADQARGNIIDIRCAWDGLLETLQKIASIGGGDFDLVKIGAQNWEFRWYTGQLGADRSNSVLFALERGNMAAPRYTYDRLNERTVAIVGGQGEGSNRMITTRKGDNWSTNNNIETFVDARSADSTAALEAAGNARLREMRAKQTFDYKVLQTPACYYGVHYKLGDLVAANYGTIQTIQKVVSIVVSFGRDGKENIEVGLESI